MKKNLSSTVFIFGLLCQLSINTLHNNAFAQAGSLDTLFGKKGIDTTIFGGGYGQSIALQPDKKIIVAGGGYKNSIYGVGVVRYNPNGGLDNTFGSGGRVYTDVGGISSWGNECALQPDGKIVVTGLTNTKGSGLFASNIQNFLIVRYNSDGSLDNTFGSSGSVVTGFNQKNAQAGSLAIQQDGKIITAGVVDAGSGSVSYDFAMVRYNSDGTLDNTFGNSGKVTTDFNKKNDIINCVKLQNDGKIIVAGPVSGDTVGTYYAVARYNTDGTLDNTFGSGGKVVTTFTKGDDAAYSFIIQTDGKYLVTGSIGLDNVPYIGLVRYNTDGTLDNTFGNGGKTTHKAGSSDSRGYGIVEQLDHKIVMTGVAADSGSTQKFLMTMRYHSNGKVDSTFGKNGKVRTIIGTKEDTGYSLALQSDKKIVVAGWTKDANDKYNYAVVRYNNDCEPPVITCNAPQTICAGTSTTLSGQGADSYSWSGGVTDGISFTPTIGVHTYTVTGTDSNNCKGSTATTITVNGLPTVTATADAKTVCSGTMVTLKGNGAASYTWSNGVMDNVAFYPKTTTTYTVTGTDTNKCSNTDAIKITVIQPESLLPLTANASDNEICAGDSVTLTGNNASNYTWSDGVLDGVTFNPAATHTYTLIATINGICKDTAFATIKVNALPIVTATTSAKTVCSGSSTTLSGQGANSYTWTNGVNNGVSFVPSSTLTYTVTGKDINGCTDTDTITVKVNNSAISGSVTANASAYSVCSGNSVTLSGQGANSFTWSDNVSDGISFIPSSTHTYTVTGYFDNGCSSEDTIRVVVNSLPTVEAHTSISAVCEGDSVKLQGATTLLNTQMNYTWSYGVSDGLGFIPSSTKTYTVTGTDNNGCSDTDTVTVFVHSLPIVNATASAQTVCNGSSVTLSGQGANSYNWTGGIIDGVGFKPSATKTYTVTGTDNHNCFASDTITVHVSAVALTATVTATASDDSICAGKSVILTGTTTPFNSQTTYSWSDNVTDGTAIIPSATHTYTVTANLDNGCSSTATTTVHVNALPNVLITASANSVCSGNSVTLSAASNPVSSQTTYTWTDGIINNVPFDPSATHTYTVVATDSNSCSTSATQKIIVNSLPNVTATATPDTVICIDKTVTLKGVGAATYKWSNGITNNVAFSPKQTQSYTITGTDLNNCSASDTITVVVDSCKVPEEPTTINELSNENSVIVYPNPNSGSFTIRNNNINTSYSIINELGQTLLVINLKNSNNYTIKIDELNNGVYYLIDNTSYTSTKIVVIK